MSELPEIPELSGSPRAVDASGSSMVRFEDPVVGASVLTFDGEVAECFSSIDASKGRVHRALLHVSRKDDRRGDLRVFVTTQPNGRGGGFHLTVSAADRPAVEPLLDMIEAAARRSGSAPSA